ncbi:MAG: MFS transporter, partial [Novosphingobium sp.]|nr:MFS transporter [Novosphingobium sp.]
GVALVVGVSSVFGTLGTGLLLVRFPGNRVGAATFVMPILAGMLLLIDGSNALYQMIAAACIGLTLGAESDVIAYLTSYHFGLRKLGTLFGVMTGALALGTALGPLAAAAIYDRFGNYDPFLALVIGLLALGGVSLLSLPRRSLVETLDNRP